MEIEKEVLEKITPPDEDTHIFWIEGGMLTIKFTPENTRPSLKKGKPDMDVLNKKKGA